MDKPILGYYADGEPIHEVERGFITTAAFILCSQCQAAIRAMGGPSYGALCVPCHETKLKELNT